MDQKAGKNTRGLAQARRDFLTKAGKLAVYTPPAMLAIMNPSLQAFAKSAAGCNNGLGQRVLDCQPPGLLDKEHLWNDLPTSVPGNPNNNPNK